MACNGCCVSDAATQKADHRWRRVLWIALGMNAGMFAIEIFAGFAGRSRALQADALDFLADAANYGISLGVAGLTLNWRARAAMLKGASLALLGAYVLCSAVWGAWHGSMPFPETMGLVGIAALATNTAVAFMLYRYRSGDANMRSVWICSRNDAIGNIAVLFAAAGVFKTGDAWPDLTVAAIVAGLGLRGGYQILRQAAVELKDYRGIADPTEVGRA